MPVIRDARAQNVDALAAIWFDGWQDAHAEIVPAELARHRTREGFRERMAAERDQVRVAEVASAPVGFTMFKGDELYQFYVAAEARGDGIAAALMADAIEQFRRHGVQVAWLACAIGNERAARFYEKCGWIRKGIMTSRLNTPNGAFLLDVWRYEVAVEP